MCSLHLSASQLFLLSSFHGLPCRDFQGPPWDLPKDQADTFWVNQEPTGLIHSGVLSSWFLRLMMPVRGLGISILASLLGSGWEWPCLLSQVPALPPAPAWVALGGAGPQDPDPRLPGGLLALPPLGATPLAPPAKFPRGCLIRRALAAHSWVWFFAVSGCSLGAVGEAGVTGQSDEWSVPRLAPC